MKIVEYSLAFSNDAQEFIEVVNSRIKEGWQPLGGFYEDAIGGCNQAMVKYEQNEEEKDADIYEPNNKLRHLLCDDPVDISMPVLVQVAESYLNNIKKERREFSDEMERLKKELAEFKGYYECHKVEVAKIREENEQLKKENLLLRETSKPRDNALLSSIDTIEKLDRIIYAFVANNYRYDEEEGYWIVLNNNTFECNDTARNSFVKIINQIKEKYKNENNN